MIKMFLRYLLTAFVYSGSCIILVQSNYLAQQSDNTKSDVGFTESTPYIPRVFEDSNKSKKHKKKKNAPKEDLQTTQPVAEQLSAITEVTLPVSVFDMRGGFITGLQKSDFKVFVDDRECNVDAVETKDQPLNIILLIDTSPSAYFQIKDLQNYALAVVDQLRPQDKVMVVQFNIGMKAMTELGNDHKVITKAIGNIKSDDGTSLYDAINEVFSEKLNTIAGRKALIILTDGVDTTSEKSDYEKSLKVAEKSNTTIYALYFDTYQQSIGLSRINRLPVQLQGMVPGPGRGATQAEYENGKRYLNDLINLSGGRAIRAETPAKGQKANPSKIAREIELQYYVTFRLPQPTYIGERKQLKVRVDRPGLAVLTRGSYVATN
jgi:VWFA-related protein